MAETTHKQTDFDSDRQYLAGVYAKALLGATEKVGNRAEVLQELESLVEDVLNRFPKLEATFSSPRVSPEDKINILDRVFEGKLSRELTNFLKVVARHGRLDCLRSIHRASQQMDRELQGRIAVQLSTASEVEADVVNNISERLQAALGGQIDIETSVDTELIGGLVLRIGDTVYDGSVANQLTRMRTTTMNQTNEVIRATLDRFTTTE